MSSQPASFRQIQGVPPSKPNPQDSVLIIVDAQNEYDHGKLAIHDIKSSRAVIAKLLKQWRDANGYVVHVTHKVPEGAPIFTPGTELAEEFEELRPEGGGEKVVTKIAPSAFTATDLDAHLKILVKALNKDKDKDEDTVKIVLVGYMAHVCISSTTRAGLEMGYDISVVRDGIGDRDIPGASATQLVQIVLAELGDFAATIVDSGDL